MIISISLKPLQEISEDVWMAKIWFIAQGQEIRGPFNTDEIEGFLANGSLSSSSLIWWKGQGSWQTVSYWKSHLQTILENFEPQEDKEWFVQHGVENWGPVSKTDLMRILKKAYDPTIFRLWKIGMDKWQSIYFFEEICELLGIQKRTQNRVPLTGSAIIKIHNETMIAVTASISIGGFGLQKTRLPVGEIVEVKIKSPVFANPICATAEVRYCEANGNSGLRFKTLPAEAQSTIHDYLNKFIKAAA